MKISARINEQFNIKEEDLKVLIDYARHLNFPEDFDDVADEARALEILAMTFGEREGYIPGDWLDYYAEEIGIDTMQWKHGCADIDLG